MEPTITYVVPYTNPDLDGIASSIGYANLLNQTNQCFAVPGYWGKLNKQSKYVLDFLEVGTIQLTSIPKDVTYILVDTHHPDQLPISFPNNAVIQIIDHHPDGDQKAYPNADIQNEAVGAAATLVVERYMAKDLTIPKKLAGLLGLAIVSNTLNFRAPSTSPRDHDSFRSLALIFDFGHSLIEGLFLHAFDIQLKTVKECLSEDMKTFHFNGLSFGISQLETFGIRDLLQRDEFHGEVLDFRISRNLDHFIFNGVDLNLGTSSIYCSTIETVKIMEQILGSKAIGFCITLNEIAIRKTHFVNQLRHFFK